MYVAADQKFFQKYGLEVDISMVSGTAQTGGVSLKLKGQDRTQF